MGLKELILAGQALTDISDGLELRNKYDEWRRDVKRTMRAEGRTEEELRALNVKTHYVENEYSAGDTMRSVKKALRDTLSVLQEMKVPISKKLSKETALTIIEAILKNFQMHYQAMYKNPVHRKGTITQNTLEAIQIGNEYDLQRMLYSLLLPIFPTVRQEVTSDNGYGSMRADLYVDDYDVVVETKCTRDSMSEKKLVDELGADGFHYKASTIFFFVYDKASVIKNPEAFKKVFIRERNTDGKRIRMVIVPPRCL